MLPEWLQRKINLLRTGMDSVPNPPRTDTKTQSPLNMEIERLDREFSITLNNWIQSRNNHFSTESQKEKSFQILESKLNDMVNNFLNQYALLIEDIIVSIVPVPDSTNEYFINLQIYDEKGYDSKILRGIEIKDDICQMFIGD